MKLWLYLSSCLIVLTVAFHDKATADMVKVGTEAPDFTLPSTKDQNFTLSAYRGIKPVIIWFSDCCGGCESKAKAMQGLLEDYDIEILVISMLSKAPQTIEFAGRTNFPFSYLIDTEYKVVNDYVGTYKPNTWPQTNTFVVNKSGLVTFSSGPGTPIKILRNELQKIGAGK